MTKVRRSKPPCPFTIHGLQHSVWFRSESALIIDSPVFSISVLALILMPSFKWVAHHSTPLRFDYLLASLATRSTGSQKKGAWTAHPSALAPFSRARSGFHCHVGCLLPHSRSITTTSIPTRQIGLVSTKDSIKFADLAVPEPGPTEVLIQNVAVASNPKDWKVPLWMDNYKGVEGNDVAGYIAKVGAEVTEYKGGERVAAFTKMRQLDERVSMRTSSKLARC